MRVVSARIGLLLMTGVMVLGPSSVRFRAVEPLPQDSGAAGVWQKIRKLQTTASLLHTTAHPDDEHGGMLAMMSRGQGARTSLLTLTRGESGDNAIGSELFDALGLIRTEELIVSNRYYGVDEQYFTSVADYGFSKRLDEALDNWNREATLAEVVRIIRMERPFVIVSRFSGTARDGHGQHQAAGVLTQEAFRAAADPKRFPEQFEEGLRPWQALKLFVGGARSTDEWSVEVDPGVYDPVLGTSYQAIARLGLGFQRSQNSGRVVPQPGTAPVYYTRVTAAPPPAMLTSVKPAEMPTRTAAGGISTTSTPRTAKPAAAGTTKATTLAEAATASNGGSTGAGTSKGTDGRGASGAAGTAKPAGAGTPPSTTTAPAVSSGPSAAGPIGNVMPGAKEAGFFDGIDVTLPGIYRTLGLKEPSEANLLLVAIEQHVQQAISSFSMTNPAASAPALARGLTATRAALAKLSADGEVAHVLRLKERQFVDALTTSLGITVAGLAVPAGAPVDGPADALALRPLVAGQTIGVRASFVARGPAAITLRALDLVTTSGWAYKGGNPGLASRLVENRPVLQRFEVTVPPGAMPTRSLLVRESPDVPRYRPAGSERHKPAAAPPVLVRAEYEFDHTIVEVTGPVQRREGVEADGFAMRELTIVPALTLNVAPAQAIISIGSGPQKPIPVTVDITNNQSRDSSGTIAIALPQDWRADPATHAFKLAAGQQTRVTFSVSAPTVKPMTYRLDVTATADGRTYTEGYDVLAHRDLETRYHYKPAAANFRAMNVAIAPNLRVGYVMGVGDELPNAIAQLGAAVTMLDAQALTSAPLDRFDAIVLGTRAYAVRADLRAANGRLLDYAKNGGNLIVLYNTPELDPAAQAPFPGKLPADAEEVSEETAAVKILVPLHQVFTRPNRITADDFKGWMEQRGSKFWREWDGAYTALLECHDRDQAPQRGGWLYARYGKGHYSYVAYALHRQTPFGVPGAYRLLANLLSLGRT
jgi:LmbE family N-acetylglucosaminyl deacetylase